MAVAAKRTKTVVARRQDLIQGTIKSIAALGYQDSTVQTICEAAGVSRGLIGHYFDGKDELLIEAFRHLVARADALAREAVRAAGHDPLERLMAATTVTFTRTGAGRDESLVWIACWGVAPWNPGMRELHHAIWRRYRAWIQRMMEQAATERGIAIDARRAALAYAQMIDGFWLGWLMDKDAYTLKEAEEIVRDWVLDLFDARQAPRRNPGSRKAARPKPPRLKSARA
jgi:TetR/AcrR family transcriptional regulator, transcriptional repressor of bet genes